MPELAEVSIMADFITKISKNVTYHKLEKSPESKVMTDLSTYDNVAFMVKANSRGKELKVTLQIIGNSNAENLIFSMGMSGNWVVCKERKGGFILPKHAHLRLYGFHSGLKQNIALCMVDTRRFAKWTWKPDFSPDRSPCPVTEHDYFIANYIMKIAHRDTRDENLANIPAIDVIMNQSIFNGIGNYLRAEIFYRANINPFRVLSSYSPKEHTILTSLCGIIPLEVIKLGGGAMKDWSGEESNKNRFLNWLRCYMQGNSIFDKSKRKFWYNPKWESSEEYLQYVYGKKPEILKLKKEVEDTKQEKNKLVKAQDFEKAALLRDKEKELVEMISKTLYALQTIEKANK